MLILIQPSATTSAQGFADLWNSIQVLAAPASMEDGVPTWREPTGPCAYFKERRTGEPKRWGVCGQIHFESISKNCGLSGLPQQKFFPTCMFNPSQEFLDRRDILSPTAPWAKMQDAGLLPVCEGFSNTREHLQHSQPIFHLERVHTKGWIGGWETLKNWHASIINLIPALISIIISIQKDIPTEMLSCGCKTSSLGAGLHSSPGADSINRGRGCMWLPSIHRV